MKKTFKIVFYNVDEQYIEEILDHNFLSRLNGKELVGELINHVKSDVSGDGKNILVFPLGYGNTGVCGVERCETKLIDGE